MHLITAKQASEILNIRLPRLYELARLRVIPFVRLGPHQIRFDESDLAEWAKRGGVPLEGVNKDEISHAR